MVLWVYELLFKKDISKCINFSLRETEMQIDNILTRHANLKHTENIKVTCEEECVPNINS